ncbi:hypothetical protein A3D78_02735 [Candidatus Gottesmanbacteria bacterium RIFCSPHIGHO2_02_FULL_39_14]|uniref:Glycosyltransferase RgtA/B/C/D-like domain-containing protein n=1 Tax=Candidatus Gottesmanbacteria bacterium RIFCSPHIGHO2_02_FULL_39_14 TaxID=1798383 RepID=A0A1F6A147_9BACT|nr:MAG: hypothetical protein A3D78_02735 [Candidatus Gottesmanbacteria bacterium RIFCSPHIGHO2_02_FULL_39_14]
MEFFKRKRFTFIFLILIFAAIIRFYRLDTIPGSLYTDEANQGYNAFSLLQTGKDEHGFFSPVSLRSFGDWKPPLQTWLMMPFIKFIGLTEIAVRLPSAILGVASVYLLYLFIIILLSDFKYRFRIALLSAWSLAVSPWHILESRSAMLVAVAIFFLLLAVYLFIKGIRNKIYLILSFFTFGFSLYAYYGLRVVAPLLILQLLVLYRQRFLQKPHHLFLPLVVLVLSVLPLIAGFTRNRDVLFGRARTVSVFYDRGVKLKQWELMTQDGLEAPSIFVRFYHNKAYLYLRQISANFLSHFDGRYLFLKGDTVQPFQIPNTGIMYLPDGLFLIIGGVFVLTGFGQLPKKMLIGWLIISLIPAALTFMVPTSNRTFNALVPFMVMTAAGLSVLRNKRAIFVISLVYMAATGYFFRQYFINLNSYHSDWWNYGWREVVMQTAKISSKYDNIIVADINGMPYIYYLFYNRYDPGKYQTEAIRTYTADQFGFEHVEGFDKFLFPNQLDWPQVKRSPLKNTLYIVPASLTADTGFFYEVKDPQGLALFRFYEF